jgi:hypothetical protein
MNKHLSPEQISGALLAEWTPEEQQHAAECSECRAEVDQLKDALSLFRGSVRDWADVQGAVPVPGGERWIGISPVRHWRAMRWSLAAAALLLLFVIPLRRNSTNPVALTTEVEDAMLLEQVNAQLQRRVPSSMEPFMELINGELK